MTVPQRLLRPLIMRCLLCSAFLAACTADPAGDVPSVSADVALNADVGAASRRFSARQTELLQPYSGVISHADANRLQGELAVEAERMLADFDLESLSGADRRALTRVVQASSRFTSQMRSILAREAARDDLAGFEAAVDLLMFEKNESIVQAQSSRHLQTQALLADARAPGAFRAGVASDLAFSLADLDPDARRTLTPDVLAIVGGYNGSESVGAWCVAVTLLQAQRDVLTRAEFEAARSHLAAAFSTRDLRADPHAALGQKMIDLVHGAAFRAPLVGMEAPPGAFDMRDEHGNVRTMQIHDFAGRVLVMEFGARWCSACVASIPVTNELRSTSDEADVAMVWVFEREGGNVQDAALYDFGPQRGAKVPIVLCNAGTVFAEYGISSLPSIAIVGRDGRVESIGLHPMRRDHVAAAIHQARSRK